MRALRGALLCHAAHASADGCTWPSKAEWGGRRARHLASARMVHTHAAAVTYITAQALPLPAFAGAATRPAAGGVVTKSTWGTQHT